MNIRLHSKPAMVSYDTAVNHFKNCINLVDQYRKAQLEKDKNASLTARLGVSLFAPTGIYVRGGEDPNMRFAVFGVKKTRAKVHTERIFYVPHVPILASGDYAGEWSVSWLIETDGFLYPIARDGYHGPRYLRVGDILLP